MNALYCEALIFGMMAASYNVKGPSRGSVGFMVLALMVAVFGGLVK